MKTLSLAVLLLCAAASRADDVPYPSPRVGDSWTYRQVDSRTAFSGMGAINAEFQIGWLSRNQELVVLLRRVGTSDVQQVHKSFPSSWCFVDVSAGESVFKDRSCSKPLEFGEKRHAQVDTEGGSTLYEYEYAGNEMVTTEAGAFPAYKINGERRETSGQGDQAVVKRYKTTWWFSPRHRGMMKVVRTIYPPGAGPYSITETLASAR